MATESFVRSEKLTLEDKLQSELSDPEDLSDPGEDSIDDVEESEDDLRMRKSGGDEISVCSP